MKKGTESWKRIQASERRGYEGVDLRCDSPEPTHRNKIKTVNRNAKFVDRTKYENFILDAQKRRKEVV